MLVMVAVSCSDDDTITPSITLKQNSLYIPEAAASATLEFTVSNAVSVSAFSVPEGWEIEVDFAQSLLTITSPAADNEEAVDYGTATLYAYSSTGNTASATLYLSAEAPVDLTASQANCYILTQADCGYQIPVTRCGESGAVIAPASVGLVWQNPSSLISYVDLQEGMASFLVEADSDGNLMPGNALLAAYDEAGEILWTWHLWVTPSEPEAVDGYMDRNLGAAYALNTTTEEILNSYGTYYQWGRMTPFVGPKSYDCASSADAYMYTLNGSSLLYIDYVESSAEIGTTAYAISHPLEFLLGSEASDYDWNFTHDASLWNSVQKSLYDPCPKGWRVPADFEGLAIADDLSADLSRLEPLYGWNLSTGDASLFFLGAGRRSWLEGLITNVNTNEVPKPWIGYYWTASAEASSANARALYFNLDTEDPARSELQPAVASSRANGMQVRCVRE